jgi:carbamate kinase
VYYFLLLAMKKKLCIFAFGGNEVSPVGLKDPNGKPIVPDVAMEWEQTAKTCKFIANFISRNPEDYFIITHGNGPQVGNVLLKSEKCRSFLPMIPLDVCVANTQGSMAYMLAQLNSELQIQGINKKACGLVTQVVVDKDDPDFKNPSKFVGSQYTKAEALGHKAREGWNVKSYKKDSEGHEIWRRVVPSPVPKDILELSAVEAVLKSGNIPIAVGGGGVPVVKVEPQIIGDEEMYVSNYEIAFKRPYVKGQNKANIYTGIEAVIDKDFASALLGQKLIENFRKEGQELDAYLYIFTGEDGAKLNYQRPDQIDLRKLTSAQTRELLDKKPCPFPAGSMGPKIRASLDFVKNGGKAAYITKTELVEKTLKGEAGTTIVP